MCIYDVYGPCSCPHGRCFTLLTQCFTVSSFVTSLLAVTSCFYMYVRPIPEEGEAELPREGFGYLSRQVGVMEPPNYSQCVFWTGEEKKDYFDGMWRAGKAMSILCVLVGGVVMCIIMCTCCVAFQTKTFDGLFYTCLFCFIAQSLTFLAWGSDMCDEMECTWSSGTGMNITAAMLWIWAANMIKSFPEALPPRSSARRKPDYDEEEDSPYLNPNRGFEDEYEEDTFQNDGSYADNYDGSYYDDDGYGEGDYYDDDQEYEYEYEDDQFHPDGYVDEGQKNDGYADDPYETDYIEPNDHHKQGRDDEFEPNEQFRDHLDVDDESQFSESKASSDNAFIEGKPSSSAEFSKEEKKLLPGGEEESTIGDID